MALLALTHWLTCDLLQDWALSIVGAVVGMEGKQILKSTATIGRITVGTRRNTEDARRPDEIASQQEA